MSFTYQFNYTYTASIVRLVYKNA